ncbi:type IV-A pilus assembly ATPase PilB [soil metagenome]
MSVLSASVHAQVEQQLVSDKLVAQADMDRLKKKAADSSVPLLSLLVSEKVVDNETLTKTIAQITKVGYVNLLSIKVDAAILDLLPHDIAERYMAVPLGEMQHRLVVAMLDADNVQAVDFLSNKIERPLKVYSASEEGIRKVLAQYKSAISQEVQGVFADQAEIESLVVDTKAKKSEVSAISQDSPISKILTAILEYAASHLASDIHIEPTDTELKIRCRIDGILREVMKLPKASEPPIVSRIKILSNLKIDEHRIPQDGQFSVKLVGREIDLRVSISPVVWGEQVVIRLLDKSGTSFKLEDMGYLGRSLRTIKKGVANPNGMVLTSGPTGSGKSTSLYALIQEIKNDSINIVTLEDPVEYKMAGINQIQVNADVGLTFSAGLRSILRQDPNVVMVGEIRDPETANLAVQAALTGHLVFSTLHTNSAAGILPRLLDMGVEPFLIASTVRTVIGQRLVRRLAEPESYKCDKLEAEAINKYIGHLLPEKESDVKAVAADLGYETLPLRGQTAYTLYKGKDTPDAPGGYKGRLGLYEVFDVKENIQDLILKRASSAEIQKAAQVNGMITMQQDGYLKALAGKTTLSEVNRVAADDVA